VHQRGEAGLGDQRVRQHVVADRGRYAGSPGGKVGEPGRAFDVLGGNTSGSVTLSIRIVIRAASTGASPISVIGNRQRGDGGRLAATVIRRYRLRYTF
jgi:hypothetical protein